MAKENLSTKRENQRRKIVAGEDSFPDENPNRPREYHGRRTLVAAVLVLGAIALALWLALKDSDEPLGTVGLGTTELPAVLNPERLPTAAQIGVLAPDFQLETLKDGLYRLSDSRGGPILVNFWASWCGPCRREIPAIVRIQDRFRSQGLVVVGVNIEEARDPATRFAEAFGVNYLIPMDFSGSVTRAYRVFGPPYTYLINSNGIVTEIIRGQAPDGLLERLVVTLLTEEAALVR